VLILLIGLFLAGASVYLVARAVAMPRMRTAETIAQIDAYGYSRSQGGADEKGPSVMKGALDDIAGAVGGVIAGRFGSLRETELRNKLMAAGLYTTAPRKFIGYQTLAALTFPAAWIWMCKTSGLGTTITVLGFAFAIYIGWRAPMIIVDRRARRRLEDIDYELPELVDILVVTVEAGLGFAGSLQVASERIDGALGDELRLALQEQNMGLTTEEALRHMLDRADTPAVRSFVRAVTQGETLGVSIGDILRSLATEMRKRRKAAAEERAQKAPIKILFPLVFLIFPAMFVILLGPAIFSFLDALRGH
jgi:tight adherence protein C